MKRRNLFVLPIAALISGCGKRLSYDTPSKKPERRFAAAPSIVSAAIASKLASAGFSVNSADDKAVVARKFEPRLHGLFTSPPPNSSTEVQYEFTLIGNGDGTRVIADASIVSINGNGVEHSVPNAPNEIVEEMNTFLNSVNA